jgi:hypothetical protein
MRPVRKVLAAACLSLALMVPSLSHAAPGDVLTSWWPAGLSEPWGLGYTGTLWVSDAFTDTNYEFASNGTPSGRAWRPSWVRNFPADMTYLPAQGWLCQVNVSGDNGIHCWDPNTGTETDAIVGAFSWTSASQRGLAYRASDDTFYVGGWNQGVVYLVKGLSYADRGTVVDQCMPPVQNIAGLAYNAASNVLWAATNGETDTIYQLRLNPTQDNCEVLGTLPHPQPGWNGAGLEMDENGNLWMVSYNSGIIFLVDSGVPATLAAPVGTPSLADVVAAVPNGAFRSLELRRALEARLDAIQNAIDDGRVHPAAQMLRALRMRLDGCGSRADRDDWIVECDWQSQVRSVIDTLLVGLGG